MVAGAEKRRRPRAVFLPLAIVARVLRFLWFGARGLPWWRRLLSLACFLLVMAIVLLAIAWNLVTDSEFLRRKLTDALRWRLGMEVEISSVEFSPAGGLNISGLRIYESGWDNLVRLSSCEVDIDILRAVFDGYAAIGDIKLDGLQLTLTEDPVAGKWNWPASSGGESFLTELELPRELPDFTITNASIVRREVRDGESVFIASRPLRIKRLADSEKFDWAVEYELSDKSLLGGSMRVTDGVMELAIVADAKGDSPLLPAYWRGLSADHAASGMLSAVAHIYKGKWAAMLAISYFSLTGLDVQPLGSQDISGLSAAAVVDASGISLQHVVMNLPTLGDTTASVSGRMDGLSYRAQFDLDVKIDKLQLPLSCDESELGQKINSIQQDYRLGGQLDAGFKLTGSLVDGFKPTGSIEFSSLDALADELPLRLENLSGILGYDGSSVHLGSVTGRINGSDLTLQCEFDTSRAAYKLDAKIDDMDIGQPLRDAMAGSSLESISGDGVNAYDWYSPSGHCDIEMHISKAADSERPDYSGQLSFGGDASVAYHLFPVRATDITGIVVFADNAVKIEKLSASRNGAPVSITGEFSLNPQQCFFDMILTGRSLELDDEVARAIGVCAGEKIADAYNDFNLTGRSDFVYKMSCDGNWHYCTWTLQCELFDGAMNYTPMPYTLDDMSASVYMDMESVKVRELNARSGDAEITASCIANLQKADIESLDLRGRNVAFDKQLRDFLVAVDSESADWWDQFQPSGKVDIHYRMSGAARDDEAGADAEIAAADKLPADIAARPAWQLDMDFKNAACNWDKSPIAIRNITGHMKAGEDMLEIDALCGSDGDLFWQLSGMLAFVDRQIDSVSLSMKVDSLAVTPELLKGLDNYIADVSTHIKPTGSVSAMLDTIEFRRKPIFAAAGVESASKKQYQPQLEMAGQLTLDGCQLDASMEVGDIYAPLDIKLQLTGDQLAAAIQCKNASGTFGDWAIEAIDGKFDKPLNSVSWTAEASGRAFGGKIACDAKFTPAADGDYQLSLLLEDARLSTMLADAETMQGQFDATLELSERFAVENSRQASGSFRVSNSRLAQAPLMLGLTNMIFLQLPVEMDFTEGSGDYYMQGNTVHCRRISLTGRDVSILGQAKKTLEGAGTIDLDTQQLDLIFVVGPPRVVVGPVAQLWSLAMPNVVATRVHGPWLKPKTETIAFENLRKLLAEMGIGTSK